MQVSASTKQNLSGNWWSFYHAGKVSEAAKGRLSGGDGGRDGREGGRGGGEGEIKARDKFRNTPRGTALLDECGGIPLLDEGVFQCTPNTATPLHSCPSLAFRKATCQRSACFPHWKFGIGIQACSTAANRVSASNRISPCAGSGEP